MKYRQKSEALICSPDVLLLNVVMSESSSKIIQENITVRSAKPQDSAEAAKLIYMTGERIFKFLLHPQEEKSVQILKRLYEKDANDFTHENAYIADMDGRIVGLVHVVDRDELKKNYRSTGLKLIKTMGLFPALKRMPRCIQFERLFPQPEKDTMYINHLATFEEFRGQGVARKLMEFCEQQVVSRQLSKLALDVEVLNKGAIRVYEKFGFKTIQKIESEKFKVRFGFHGIYRMVKPRREFTISHKEYGVGFQK